MATANAVTSASRFLGTSFGLLTLLLNQMNLTRRKRTTHESNEAMCHCAWVILMNLMIMIMMNLLTHRSAWLYEGPV